MRPKMVVFAAFMTSTFAFHLVAQNCPVVNEKIALRAFALNPKAGDVGNMIHDVILVQDWVCVVVEQAQALSGRTIGGVRLTESRLTHVLAYNLKTEQWRSLKLPENTHKHDMPFQFAELQSGAIRIHVVNESTAQTIDWQLSAIEPYVSDVGPVAGIQDAVSDYFGQPFKSSDEKNDSMANAENWSLISGSTWDKRAFDTDTLYFHHDLDSENFICLRDLGDNNFDLRKLSSMNDFPGSKLWTKADLEKKYGDEIVEVKLPKLPPNLSRVPAVFTLKNGQVICDLVDEKNQHFLELFPGDLKEAGVDGVALTNSGMRMAVSVYRPDDDSNSTPARRLFIISYDDDKKESSVFSIQTELLVESFNLSLAAISDNGDVFFFNGESIFHWTFNTESKSIDYPMLNEIEFIGED